MRLKAASFNIMAGTFGHDGNIASSLMRSY